MQIGQVRGQFVQVGQGSRRIADQLLGNQVEAGLQDIGAGLILALQIGEDLRQVNLGLLDIGLRGRAVLVDQGDPRVIHFHQHDQQAVLAGGLLQVSLGQLESCQRCVAIRLGGLLVLILLRHRLVGLVEPQQGGVQVFLGGLVEQQVACQ